MVSVAEKFRRLLERGRRRERKSWVQPRRSGTDSWPSFRQDSPDLVDSYGRNLAFWDGAENVQRLEEEGNERAMAELMTLCDTYEASFGTLQVEIAAGPHVMDASRTDFGDEEVDVLTAAFEEEQERILEQVRQDEELARTLQEIEEEEGRVVVEAESRSPRIRDEDDDAPAISTRATIMTSDGRRVVIPEVMTTRVRTPEQMYRILGMEDQMEDQDRGFVPMTSAPASMSAPSPSTADERTHGPAEMDEVARLPTRRIGAALQLVQDTCSICLMEYESRQTVMTLPCLHQFHSNCATSWLTLKRTCPVCKSVAC